MFTTRRMAWMFIVVATLLGSSPTFCYGDEDNWIVEPHQTLHLSIGKQSFNVEAGEPTKIAIDGKETSVSVNSDRYRTFKTDSFSFDYPATFRFRREKIEPGADIIHCCQLDGDHIVVRIAEKTPKMDFTSFAAYFREKYSKAGDGVVVTEKREEFKVANSSLDEMTFVMNGTVSENPFFQVDRCFLIPTANKETCVMLTVSIPVEPGSDEAKDFIATLGKTLAVKGTK